MRTTVLAIAVVSFVSLRAADSANPQTPAGSADQGLVMIVTETKIPQPQESVTQKVNVIYDSDLSGLTTANRNISELLQYQPGVAVTTLSRNDANWGSYGGLGPKYNSYLLDGVPIDAFVDTMSLDPWAFDRIETHQGPASVMYSNYLSMDFAGNQAPLAGITNLVLKDEIQGPATRLMVGGGSWNTFNGRLFHQDRKGPLSFFFGANYEQSDYTDYGTPNSWLNMLESPAYKKTKLYGKAIYELGREDHRISLFLQRTSHSGFAGRPNRDYGHGYDTVNAAYSNQIDSRLRVQLKTGFRNYDRRWGEDNYPPSLALREHDGVEQKVFPTDLTVNYLHAGDSVLTAGTDLQYSVYRTYAEATGSKVWGNDATGLSNGLYLQEKYVSGKWVVRAGGRLSRTRNSYSLISGSLPGLAEKSWTRFLWSAGARYNASDEIALYTNAGSSFIPPSAKSVGGTLNASDQGVAGRNGQLPNPDLKPESGTGYDFGADLRVASGATLGLRFFYNRLHDAIVENVVSNNPSQSRSVNAGEARSYGFEIPFEHQATEHVRLFANLTRTITDLKNPFDPDQDGADITFVPNYVLNAGVHCALPNGFSVSPYLRAVGTYYDSTSRQFRGEFGPYQVVNLRIEKSIAQTNGYTTVLFADLNNLTHRRFEMPWQFRDPGFNIFGGIELRFE